MKILHFFYMCPNAVNVSMTAAHFSHDIVRPARASDVLY